MIEEYAPLHCNRIESEPFRIKNISYTFAVSLLNYLFIQKIPSVKPLNTLFPYFISLEQFSNLKDRLKIAITTHLFSGFI